MTGSLAGVAAAPAVRLQVGARAGKVGERRAWPVRDMRAPCVAHSPVRSVEWPTTEMGRSWPPSARAPSGRRVRRRAREVPPCAAWSAASRAAPLEGPPLGRCGFPVPPRVEWYRASAAGLITRRRNVALAGLIPGGGGERLPGSPAGLALGRRAVSATLTRPLARPAHGARATGRRACSS